MKQIVLGILFFSSVLFAGGVTGGGHVVQCTDIATGTTKVRLLDYYEGELLYSLVHDHGSAKTEMERVNFVLKRLSQFDKDRAAKYAAVAKDFFSNVLWVDKVNLPHTNDHNYVPLEENCTVHQVAVQNLTTFKLSKKYTIHKGLYNQLSMADRAGLILHEIIYEFALARGHKTSMNSRYFNALIGSTNLEVMTAEGYDKELEQLGLGEAKTKTPFRIPNPVIQRTMPPGSGMLELKIYVSNPDTTPLSYKLVCGPGFAAILKDRLYLDPASSDEGDHVIEVEVSDGSKSETITFKLKVQGEDFRWKTGDKWMPKAVVGLPFGIAVSHFTEGEFLGVSLIDGPRWLKLVTMRLPEWKPGTFGNVLQGSPSTDDSGPFTVTLELESQDGSKTQATIYGSVVYAFPDDSKAQGPIARVNHPYSLNLNDVVALPLCSVMTWSISSRPHWLQVKGKPRGTSTGSGTLPILEGTPTSKDVYTYRMNVEVSCHGKKESSKTEVEIAVLK